MNIKIVPALPEHIDMIAPHVRKVDRDEIWASGMQVPERALRSGLKYSDVAFTGFVDDIPVCMWGICMDSLMGRIGVPWMLGTDKLEKYSRIFLRLCRKQLVEIREGYDTLVNYVDARNKRTIKWLQFMGFEVNPVAEPYGMAQIPFHRFEMRRIPCATQH